jgi:hypothetical protein
MSKQVPGNWGARCATCAFWCGARSLDLYRHYVTVDSGAKGRCSIGGMGSDTTLMDENTQCCPHYEKWGALK